MAVTPNFSWPTPDDSDAVSQGAAAIRSLGSAIDSTVAAGYRYAGTRYYTSSGSFAKADPLGTGDIGLRAIRVRMVAGGGGGAGLPATGATEAAVSGGGGAGAYAESFITDIAGLASSVTVTRGSGGAAGSSGNGSSGGASSFGATVTANGGGGGIRVLSDPIFTAPGEAGGTTGTGDLVIAGGDGGGGVALTLSDTRVLGGFGGASLFSGSREGGRGDNPQSGLLYGGGANGHGIGDSTAASDGAAGANGIVIIDCFV